MPPDDVTAPEVSEAAAPGKLRQRVRKLATVARAHPLALSSLTFLTSVIVIILLMGLPSQIHEENIAISWNDAIGRLEIEPIYPPQEDIYVGDVFLTLQRSKAAAKASAGKVSKLFAGRSIRVDNIPLRDSITKAPYRLDLPNVADGHGDGKTQPPIPEATGGDAAAIALSSVAFPGFSVKHRVHARAAWLPFLFDRNAAETEEIALTSIHTYSVTAPEAIRQLMLYCKSEKTGLNCTDGFARAQLAYALGDEVNAKVNGQYVYQITVSLLRQVFVAGKIKSTRYQGESLSASVEPAPKLQGGDDAQGAASAGKGSGEEVSEGSSSRTVLDQTFDPPIAVGYRSISVSIPLPAVEGQGGNSP